MKNKIWENKNYVLYKKKEKNNLDIVVEEKYSLILFKKKNFFLKKKIDYFEISKLKGRDPHPPGYPHPPGMTIFREGENIIGKGYTTLSHDENFYIKKILEDNNIDYRDSIIDLILEN